MLQQINSHLVETEALAKEPYAAVLGYPRCDGEELEARVKELEGIGVHSILFEGGSMVGKLKLLGKGCVSVVVKAIVDHRVIALKIRRTDADRHSMGREAEYLRLANRIGVGPSFIESSKNFLVMGFADGIHISKFIEAENQRTKVSSVVSEILDQCHRLDRIGLDHGELSDTRKHVIVGDEMVTMIDFESASVNRRVSNVTAVTQYLFIGNTISEKIRNMLNVNSVEPIISLLREYKRDTGKENFERLKRELNL